MKGLVYKELYLMRKTYLAFLGLGLGMAAIFALVALSTRVGNLRGHLTAEELNGLYPMFCYIPFVLLLLMMSAVENSVYNDYKTEWMKYSYTLPVSAWKAVGARFLSGILLMFVAAVLAGGNAVMMGWLMEKTVTADIRKNMLVILLAGVGAYNCIMLPLSMKLKTAQATGRIIGGIFVGVYVIAGYFIVSKSEDLTSQMSETYLTELLKKAGTIRDAVLPYAVILTIICCVMCYFVTVRIYQRREK